MLKAAPTWTMTSRNYYTHQEITPGPGTYLVNESKPGPSIRLGKSIRESIAGVNLNPGPGSYSPIKPVTFLGNTL
jgi:hypothetical protein